MLGYCGIIIESHTCTKYILYVTIESAYTIVTRIATISFFAFDQRFVEASKWGSGHQCKLCTHDHKHLNISDYSPGQREPIRAIQNRLPGMETSGVEKKRREIKKDVLKHHDVGGGLPV